LHSEIYFQEKFSNSKIYSQLPKGLIHGDLFRNNVMFNTTELTGFFDFYFAGFDIWLFDLAVSVNDWCIDLTNGKLDSERVRAMLDAYHAVRPFTIAEQGAWQTMLRASALRFWLSRLDDFYSPRVAKTLTPHDPHHFEQILQQRIDYAAPALCK
jgi:homoserine kinase type II